jgi:serine phosphatase RsbU (regulator of sigma subunit)/DNA-binding response OmpR family regulator
MSKEKILVVEDEPLVGLEIKEDLEKLGYSVPEVITSGEEVLPAVARHLPSLVVMDIRIEGAVDGIEAAYQLKAEFPIPILYLTAFSDSQTLKRAAATGPDAFLLKPFDERELAANVEMILAKARLGLTERRELENVLPLVGALEMPALVADLDDRIVHANRGAIELLGLQELERIQGQPLSRYLIEEARALLSPAAGAEGGNDGAIGAYRSVRAADGSVLDLIATVGPIVKSDGKTIGSLVTLDRMTSKERRHLESSVEAINQTLAALLPTRNSAGPGFLLGGFLLPCSSGAGDLVDAFRLDARWSAFYGLDVMGHGTLSSLVAYSLHNLVRDTSRRRKEEKDFSPAGLVSRLNDRYAGNEEGKPFFTIAYGLLDNETGEYRLARAGHPPVFLLRSRGGVECLYTKGVAVGVLSELEVEERSGKLGRGDRLIVVSDGYLESAGGLNINLAIGTLSAFIEEHRAETLDDFVESLRGLVLAERSSASLRDDASLLVVERV